MNLSGRVLSDYSPGASAAEQQPVPRGGSSGVPLRDRHHPGVGEVRGTSSAMRNTPIANSSHPWKVTSNGDASVTVANGKVLGWEVQAISASDTLPTWYNLKPLASHISGTVTVSGAGKIYGKISHSYGSDAYQSGEPGNIHYLSYVTPTGDVTVHFASTMPTSGDAFYFEIADVSLDEGNAVVDDQILQHNPQIGSFSIVAPPTYP